MRGAKGKDISAQPGPVLIRKVDPVLQKRQRRMAKKRQNKKTLSCYDNFDLGQMDLMVAEDQFFESVRPRKKVTDPKTQVLEDMEFILKEKKRRKSNAA